MISLFPVLCLAIAVSTYVSGTVVYNGKEVGTATEMYLYAWPLVMTKLTRRSMFYLPPNIMLPLPVFPNPNLTAIVRPNVDTLYSACWIDHTRAEELTLTIPDTTEGLYYLFPLMDAWTNIVDSPGWRTTGKGEQKILIRGPFANQSAPVDGDYTSVMQSTTSMTYLLGRTNVPDQDNLRPTQEQMFSYRLTQNPVKKVAEDDKKPLGKSTPVEEIFAMDAREFFDTFADLMITNPPILPQDQDIVDRMASEFGLIAGQAWNYRDLSADQKLQLTNGMNEGIDLLYKYPAKRSNGWTMPNMKTGNYSDDYYLRSYIALVLYAANLAEDAVYYKTDLFTGGGKSYEILFPKGTTPPANQFWSITLYSEEGYLVANENRTYSVSSQQSLKFRDDESLHITISMEKPSDESVITNWLPAPQAGENFSLTMRIYWPKDEVLQEKWNPPPVTEIVSSKK